MNLGTCNIKYFDKSLKPSVKSWSVDNFEYVEQLLYEVLDSINVGPVYRFLFGLKTIGCKPDCWLSPDTRIRELFNLSFKKHDVPHLELRMRFRPSSFSKMLKVDSECFELAFAQIRFDFIHSKFAEQNRDLIYADGKIHDLIAADLLRHGQENNIEPNDLFNQLHDFMPRKAPSRWQRPLYFVIREDIKKSYYDGLEQKGSMGREEFIRNLKLGYVDLFLNEICPDYASEIYRINLVGDDTSQTGTMKLRVVYRTGNDASCSIELNQTSSSNVSKQKLNGKFVDKILTQSCEKWSKICGINSVCYGHFFSISQTVEIVCSDEKRHGFKFESSLEAKSFLSLLDGYYRLMCKWYMNFCRDIISPDLENLKKIESHGPIGYATMRSKLTNLKLPETYLVRRCMTTNHRYLIDVLLKEELRITIRVDWLKKKRKFVKSNTPASNIHEQNQNVSIRVVGEEFDDLKDLVHNIQIRLDEDDINSPPLQLKHLLRPNEHDDCPANLLSISSSKLEELDENGFEESIKNWPHIIPPTALKCVSSLRCDNRTIAHIASLSKMNKSVVVKEDPEYPFIFSNIHMSPEINFKSTKSVQRTSAFSPGRIHYDLQNWLFVKSTSFVETIGIVWPRGALIQEYLPLGSLDKYLTTNESISEPTRQSIFRQLASALSFLQERHIVHGKLRCRNVFICDREQLKVKIGDPLGTIDVNRDLAFLPPEHRSFINGFFAIDQDSCTDVWALGTTMWQVYSDGVEVPFGMYANTLIKPEKCPNHIWEMIENCWVVDVHRRAQPQQLYRNLIYSITWQVKPSEPAREYQTKLNNSTLYDNFSTNELSYGSRGSGSEIVLITPNQLCDSKKQVDVNSNEVGIVNGMSKHWTNVKTAEIYTTMNHNGQNVDTDHSLSGSLSVLCDELADNLTREYIRNNLESSECYEPVIIENDKLTLVKEIGHGTGGVVMKGYLQHGIGLKEVVAVKFIEDDESSRSDRTNYLANEYNLLRKLRHGNIVKALGFVNKPHARLVIEYLPHGSLLSFIKNCHPNDMSKLPLRKYAIDIANGMKYLEDRRIIHCDLALRNILLKKHDEVKICDFGLARQLNTQDCYRLKGGSLLPLLWYAPEAQCNSWTYYQKSDVWSYGVVLWEIYSGGCRPQYSGRYSSLEETLKYERLLMPKNCPRSMYNLMLDCWKYQHFNRPSFASILHYVFFEGNSL